MTRLQARGVAYVLLLLPGAALAQGFRGPAEGPYAIGRPGGKIALIDDATAISINPANIAGFDRPTMLNAVSVGYAAREFTSVGGVKTESEHPWYYLPYAYGTFPLAGGKYVTGIGISGAFGRVVEWERDGPLKYAAPYSTEIRVLNVNPTLAAKLSDTVSIAAGLDAFWADVEIRQDYPWASVTGNATTPDGTARYEGDGVAFGWNAAVAWQMTPRQRVALTYRAGFDVDVDGSFRISNVPPPSALPQPLAGVTASSSYDSTLNLPDVVSFGYGLQVTETFNIGIDIEWARHSRLENMTIDVGSNNVLLPGTSLPQDWTDEWNYGCGMEWDFKPEWTLRSGVIFLNSPVSDRTLTPEGSEEDYAVIGVGLGYTRDSHRIDLAYAYSVLDGREVTGNQIPAFDGEYDFTGHLMSLGYQYTF